MPTYFVSWEIDIDANSPREAAKRALEIQRNPQSTATQFYIQEHDTDERVSIDFLEEQEALTGWMDGEETEVCPGCGAIEGLPEWGTVGDGFDGYCPSCADRREAKREI